MNTVRKNKKCKHCRGKEPKSKFYGYDNVICKKCVLKYHKVRRVELKKRDLGIRINTPNFNKIKEMEAILWAKAHNGIFDITEIFEMHKLTRKLLYHE